MKKVLFVCTGNTCRSVMAEALAKRWLEQHGFDEVQTASAGLAAFPEMPASPQAVEVMQKRDLDISQHTSRLLDESTVSEADVIFAMTSHHLQHLLSLYPEAEKKARLLSEEDIADPIGGNVEEYEKCAALLEEKVSEALEEWTSRSRK